MSDTKIDLSLFFDEKPEKEENDNEIKVKDSDKRENNDSSDRIDSIDKAISFINENIKEKSLDSSETQNVNTLLENAEDKPLNITDEETKVESKTIASDEIAKKASSFKEEDLFEELKNIFKDVPENAEKCYNLINPDSRGFRAYFVGEMTGTKGTILKELNKLLFKLGKVKTDRYVNLAFNEIEELEEWDTQTLYVVSNLTDAYVNLFASKGQSEQDKTTSRYSRMLESLIKAPLNAYIILDSADRTSQRNFLDIDPRIGFLFSNTCIFPDFSDDKIANDLIKRIEVYPNFNSNPISNTDVVDFLDGNRKFYPFKNNELTNYLDMIYRSTGNLPPSKEDSFNLENSLNQFIGMEDAKTIIRRMEKYLRARRLFKEKGIDTSKAQFSLHTALIGPAGTGKCYSVDERVLTPSGWVRNGDLKIGDKLIDHKNNIVTVKGVYKNGVKQLYNVTFDDNTSIEATLDHQWLIQDMLDRNKKNLGNSRPETFKVMTTEDILRSGLTAHRKDGALIHKFSIPITDPIEFPERELPLSPYFVGAFLSRGFFFNDKPYINIYNNEVKQKLESLVTLTPIESIDNRNKRVSIKTYLISIKNQKNIIKDMFLNNMSIPNEYMFSSLKQRQELISGFFDCIGNTSKPGIIFKPTKTTPLKDFDDILRSVGFKLYVRKNAIRYISFSDVPFWITTLPSKLIKLAEFKSSGKSIVRNIVSIEPSRKAEVQCISVVNDTVKHKKGSIIPHYKLTLSSGREYIVSEDEIFKYQDIKDRETSYYSGTIKREQSYHYGTVLDILHQPYVIRRKNISFDLHQKDYQPMFFENELKIHPYILGVLIGDGCITTSTPSITCQDSDKEIIDKVKELLPQGYTLRKVLSNTSSCPQYNIVQVDKKLTSNKSFSDSFLKELGLSGKNSSNKFIPIDYLYTSIENRFWLLKGLMDTDGTTDISNAYYSTVSKKLAEDIRGLVFSLGGIARINSKQLYTGSTSYNITINFPRDYAFTRDKITGEEISNIFFLQRKAKKYNPLRDLSNFKDYLINVEYVGNKKIEKDIYEKQNFTYIAGDYVTSHNTSLARVLSKLYFQMGFLPSEKLVEIGGIDLMGANEAQSAAKAAKAVSEAMGGALFIDEVYGLSSDAAIACIVKNMTDNVDNFAVFIAGYQKETRIWLARNTGLQSRIGTYININPYTEEELIQIYFMKMKNMGFTIKDSPEMRKKLAPLISYAIRDRNSGNGRFCERMSQSTLLMISNKYFEDPSRDISVVDADVIPPISEVIKSFS